MAVKERKKWANMADATLRQAAVELGHELQQRNSSKMALMLCVNGDMVMSKQQQDDGENREAMGHGDRYHAAPGR
jgi:hypothetical protein